MPFSSFQNVREQERYGFDNFMAIELKVVIVLLDCNLTRANHNLLRDEVTLISLCNVE